MDNVIENTKERSKLEQIVLNAEIVKNTKEIKQFLLNIKTKLDEYDVYMPDNAQQIEYIEKHKHPIFEQLDEHFFRIWELAKNYSGEELNRHKRFYQKELVPLFEVSPYNKRVYEKPFGYAGDFVVMLYLYENGYEGDSTYAKLIHRYSMHVPAARANHNRKEFYKNHINEFIENNDNPKIFSIACGPAVEIIEIVSSNPLAENAVFSCLDFEPKAIEYIKEKISSLNANISKKISINYIIANIKDLLRYDNLNQIIEDQDLIYSSGLIDYFNDKLASKMIEVLFKKIRPGGKLIVGNVSDYNKHRAYTEILGEWYVNHRNENDMIKLAERIDGDKILEIEYEKETKMNVFLIINKPKW